MEQPMLLKITLNLYTRANFGRRLNWMSYLNSAGDFGSGRYVLK